MSSAFEYVLPAVLIMENAQERSSAYSILLPYKILLKLLNSDIEKTIPTALVARRALEEASIQNIEDIDVLQSLINRANSITVITNADVIFERFESKTGFQNQGLLRIPMEADFTVINGIQTLSTLKSAIIKKPELLEIMLTLKLCSFPSENHLINHNNSINLDPYKIDYFIEDSPKNLREQMLLIAKAVTRSVRPFSMLTDFERSSLPVRSKYLFTISSIRTATYALLKNYEKNILKQTSFAIEYWLAISQYMTEWTRVLNGELTAGEVRQNYVHSHAPTLYGFGHLGATLIEEFPSNWSEHLNKLSQINWQRSNPDWQGRIIIDGRVSKTRESIILMTSYLKKSLNLRLTPEEEDLENQLQFK